MNNNTFFPKLGFTNKAQLIGGLCLLSLMIFNTFTLYQETTQIQIRSQKAPYPFFGNQYKDFIPLLKGIPRVSYYTDKNIKQGRHGMQFAQAQMVLAPTILDPDDLSRPLIILDCSSLNAAKLKVKELGVTPLKANRLGLVLARR